MVPLSQIKWRSHGTNVTNLQKILQSILTFSSLSLHGKSKSSRFHYCIKLLTVLSIWQCLSSLSSSGHIFSCLILPLPLILHFSTWLWQQKHHDLTVVLQILTLKRFVCLRRVEALSHWWKSLFAKREAMYPTSP